MKDKPTEVEIELHTKASEQLEKEVQAELENPSEETSIASLLEE